MVVGFWKRVWSDILDMLFLALVGFTLSLALSDWFYSLGYNGLWIGLFISFFYTGLLQSSLGQGQSLAKKILKIQVLRLDGSFLSLPRSFLRYSILALIAYNSILGQALNFTFPGMKMDEVALPLILVLLLVGCYLMVPLHPLKRGLHDLIVGSIVVRKGTYSPELVKVDEEKARKIKNAYIICSATALVFFILGAGMVLKMPQMLGGEMGDMIKVRDAVGAQEGWGSVQIQATTTLSSRPTQKKLILKGFIPKKVYQDSGARENEVEKVVKTILATSTQLKDYDSIRIIPATGYSIGIWSFNESDGEDFGIDGKKLSRK